MDMKCCHCEGQGFRVTWEGREYSVYCLSCREVSWLLLEGPHDR